MSPIDPAELSAYLDGELDAARTREVEAALADSSALRAELNTLVRADGSWRAAARTAAFIPRVLLQPERAQTGAVLRLVGGAVLLLLARIVPKLPSTLELGLILNGVALAVALIFIVRMTVADVEERSV